MRNQKQLLAFATAGIILAGGIGYWALQHFLAVPGQLYRYYPASTGFYLELAPGEKLTRRFIAALQQQAAREEQEAAQPVPGNAAEKTLNAQEFKQKRFRRAFLQKFNNTFDSYFSLGSWPDSAKTPQDANLPSAASTENNSGTVLIIFPLKAPLTLPQIVRRFDLEPNDFDIKQPDTRHAELSYFMEKETGTTLAVLDKNLLITSTESGMKSALAHYTHHDNNVFNTPENSAFLAQLPWFRQGTFILNNSVYSRKMLSHSPLSSAAGMPPALSAVLPLTVGSIQALSTNLVTLRTVTPIYLQNIPDATLRQHLQDAYGTKTALDEGKHLPADTALLLGISDPDKLYDFYQAHLMPTALSRWTGVANFFLAGFHLDFRRDLVSLLGKRTVIGAHPGQPMPAFVLVEKDEQKDKILNKLSTLLSTGVFPIHQQQEQIDDISVRTIDLPSGFLGETGKVSYGSIGESIVFANPTDFLQMERISEGKQETLASAPLYRAVMTDLPDTTSILLYLNLKDQPGLHSPNQPIGTITSPASITQWLDAVGLSLRVDPYQKNKIDILNGQINLKIARTQ
jgi:hypothetical protein